MVSLLPPVQDDETVRCYSTRLMLLNGLTARAANEALFGAASRSPDPWLPSSLETFAQVTTHGSGGLDYAKWAQQHTLYPYFASLATAERAACLLHRMQTTPKGPVRPVRALSSVELQIRLGRICTICAAAELATLGFSYVHRTAMLPYVSRCVLHGTVLVEDPEWTPVSRCGIAALQPDNTKQNDSIAFARASQLLLKSPVGHGRKLLIAAGQDAHWLLKSGRLRRGRLLMLLQDRFSDGFDNPFLSELALSEKGHYLVTTRLAHERGLVHPVIAALILAASPASAGSSAQREVAKRRDISELLSAGINAVDRGQSIRGAAVQAGISPTTLSLALRRRRLADRNAQRTARDLVFQRAAELLCDGWGVEQTARALNVSAVSVRRAKACATGLSHILKQGKSRTLQECHRLMWSTVIEYFGHAEGVAQLRSRAPASYAWLYRNDRAWLSHVQPVQRAALPLRRAANRPSLMRPAKIVACLRAATTKLRARSGIPLRITRGRLISAVGFERDFDWTALPEAARAEIVGLLESRRDFLYRRLQWARTRLQEEGLQVTVSALVRKAAVRPSSLSAVGIDVADQVADFNPAVRNANAA